MKHVSAELNRVEEIGAILARKREVAAEREARERLALVTLPSETPEAAAAREAALELREALAEAAPKRPAPLPCKVTLAVKVSPTVTIPEHARKGAAQCAAGFANLNGDLAALLAAKRAGVELPVSLPDAKPRVPRGPRTAQTSAAKPAEKAAEKAAKPVKVPSDVELLDMTGGIVRVYANDGAAPIVSNQLVTRTDAMRRASAFAGQGAIMSGPMTKKVAASGWTVGVDVRPEGVRERPCAPDKLPLPIPEDGFTFAAWKNSAPINLPDWWQDKDDRFVSAKLGRMIIEGTADRAVIAYPADKGATQTELLPYRGKVEQVGANGIVRPTAERFGWSGAAGAARPDSKDRFECMVVVPTMEYNSRGQSLGSGAPRRIEQKFATEAQARAWVLNAIEVQHAYEGTISGLGKVKLAVKDGGKVLEADERFEVIPAEGICLERLVGDVVLDAISSSLGI